MNSLLLSLVAIFILACSPTATNSAPSGPLPKPDQALTAPADSEEQTAVFAAGCFWCVEAVFERVAGVNKVVSGYAGGSADDADYQNVSAGKTKHAEAVVI